MKVRTQQLNPTIGAIQQNTSAIIEAVKNADEVGMDLLILPELAVPGYPPMDLLERNAFRKAIYRANDEVIRSTEGTDVALIFGSVTANTSEFGRKCFNSAVVARDGQQIAEVHKTLLPTYDVFDDLRYFEENKEFSCIELEGVKIGVTICEDIWYNENDIQYHRYEVNPARRLAEVGAEAIVNISASPFTKSKPGSRRQMLQNHTEKLELPIFYANQVGANTELIFDGDSMVVDARQQVIARAPLFQETFIDVDWETKSHELKSIDGVCSEEPCRIEGIFKALELGLQDYLAKTGVSDKVILGLSGGIDSALVSCIAAEALGPDKVMAVTMPSEFSSEGSVNDSQKLADNLGIELHRMSVKDLYDDYLQTLSPLFKGTSFGVAEENLQSRIRGALLMAISNKFGYMLLNTGNKSELATGYCTLYGDMAGGLGVIADMYKTEVYEMSRWLNEHYYGKELIPKNIIDKPPSAELKPDQKDSDTLPDYDMLDAILELYIEKQQPVELIAQKGFDKEMVKKVINLVDRVEYKRFQSVPALKVSTKAFGTGRRWPMVQGWSLQ